MEAATLSFFERGVLKNRNIRIKPETIPPKSDPPTAHISATPYAEKQRPYTAAPNIKSMPVDMA
jgi:hypothetical protein